MNHLGGTENSGFPLSPQDQYDNKTYCGLGIDPSANLIPVLNQPTLIAGGLRCDGVISEPWAPHQDPQK